MKPEGFKNSTKGKIEVSEQETVIIEKLESAQLRFADALCRKQEFQDFADILGNTTSIIESLEDSFKNAYPEGREKLVPAYVEGIKQAINKIREENPNDWESKVKKFLQVEQKKLNEATNFANFELDPELPQIGPIAYEIVSIPSLAEFGAKYGLGPNDSLMELHLEDIYKFPDMSITPKTLLKHFEEISRYLKDHPHIKAVIGESWLIDHPIGHKLGFKKITEAELEKNALDTWSQLITQGGEINEERLNQAIEKGVLPFQSVLGYITREDFLERYGIKKEKGISVEGAPA
ncbi:MAG: hypothetical protein M3M85_02065 [bacterium]|nr:hypothetical protein [bacterium]